MLAETEVRQLHMAILVDEDVVGLEVSVDKVDPVHRLNAEDGLGNVKPALVFGKDVFAHEQRHEIAAGQEVHDEVEILVVLETKFEVHNPVVLGFDEHFSFSLDVVHLILIYHFRLLHPLHGHHFPRLDVPADPNFSKGTPSNDRQGLEVPCGDLFAHFSIELSFLVQDVLLDKLLLST